MGDLKVIQTVSDMHRTADEMRASGLRIGLVPTMGYLHGGHLSLIRQARRASDRVVVSIFVNPMQFGPQEDYATYPSDFERDVKLIQGMEAIWFTRLLQRRCTRRGMPRMWRLSGLLSTFAGRPGRDISGG